MVCVRILNSYFECFGQPSHQGPSKCSPYKTRHISLTVLRYINSMLTHCNYNSTDISTTQSQTTHHALDRIQLYEPRTDLTGVLSSSSKCLFVIFSTTPCISLSLNEQAGGVMRRCTTVTVETEGGKYIVGRHGIREWPLVFAGPYAGGGFVGCERTPL